ncbi:hypothetical protein FRC09_005396 [Ceratobasidium sp. 395]|nr:hypothetical protein FRC09_005396 [Ceratobasidium sp. 395]
MTTDIPSSVQAWRLPKDEEAWVDHHSIQLRDVSISPPGEGEVLVKLRATSLNYRIFPANVLIRIPSYLTYEEAATLPGAGLTAWACLFETAFSRPVGPGSTILAQGSGGVSVFGAQLAKVVGARVIATTSSADKAEKYRKLVGANEVINYRETPEWSEEVRKLTDGKGVEQILEVGGQTTLPQSLKAAQVGGHIHILGMVGGFEGTDINFAEFSMAMILGRLNLHGQMVGSKVMLQRLVEFMEKHKIKPVIGKAFEWGQAVEAFDYMAAGAHFGKVVIKIA